MAIIYYIIKCAVYHGVYYCIILEVFYIVHGAAYC